MTMKMILSGGGTAGHIYPALALADELASRDIESIYLGTSCGPEKDLAKQAGLEFVGVKAAGFDRAKPTSLLTSTLVSGLSALATSKLLRSLCPAAVVCFGGYVSIPVGLAAGRCKLPLVIHEQNSAMGMTNRSLAKRARLVALSYPNTSRVPACQSLVTGNPVRLSVLTSDGKRGREAFGLSQDALVLVVFGGSRGARHINQALIRVAPALLDALPELELIHAAGQTEYEDVVKQCGESLSHEASKRYHCFPYLENMGDGLAAADLALTRAGAITIAELTALGVPSLLVPYPFATDDHQSTNAAALAALGGARVLNDSQLDDAVFKTTLMELLCDTDLRATMGSVAHSLSRQRAAGDLADAILGLL